MERSHPGLSSLLGGRSIHLVSALGCTGRFLVVLEEGGGESQCSSGSSMKVLFTVIPNGQATNCITGAREPLGEWRIVV